MENVWSDPKILPILNNEVILYVDDKQICQKTQQFIKTTGSEIETVGISGLIL
jgi:thiol:disulfide interchange protein DsbD